MGLRTRLLLAFAAIVLVPIALLAFGLRQEMTRRLSQEYQDRVDQTVAIIREDLIRESAGVAERLASLGAALVNDNRFRLAAVAGLPSEREYLLDYAGTAIRLTGLTTLQIQDAHDQIISSGHFRNEHGRSEPGLASALNKVRGPALTMVRTADGQFLTLARSESFSIAGQTFTLVGGIAVDNAFLARLARDRAITVSITYPGGVIAMGPVATVSGEATTVGVVTVPFIRSGAGTSAEILEARVQVTQPLSALRALLSSVDSWFLYTAAGTSLAALLLAVWLSQRLTNRLAALADKTAVLDLDRLDVEFDEGTDEVGTLSRLLGDLSERLRTSTARIREAERRATVGELARQINHDIKNGLIPLRNVMRHLAQVQRDEPDTLQQIFAERRQTLDSSIGYLETLATSYLRLSRPPERRECNLNAIVTDVVGAIGPARAGLPVHEHNGIEFVTDLTTPLPAVVGDPISFRRIIENLTANAVDSLESTPGRISISTEVVARDGEPPLVRVTVADTGRGMTNDEAGRIFNDFYTTKEGGTGLGLSIVRRLVMDLNGRIDVDSEPGRGTRITIDIPANLPART
jgi:signal transduction histidine kinase